MTGILNKNIDEIQETDLQSLITNSISEKKTIEYKSKLPSNSDSDKKAFLANVSSFANSSGGLMIFGMTENRSNGLPESLGGVKIENIDQEILRLEQTIRTGTEPRISDISLHDLRLENGNVVLIIRIGKSWNSPHRVVYKGHDKFYARSTNGKYPLDVSDLRSAFNLSESLTQSLRNFQLDRISSIHANETPIPISGDAKIVLQIFPLVSFTPGTKFDLFSQPISVQPLYSGSGWSHRINIDGVLYHSVYRDGHSRTYTQVYSNGIIEAVDGSLLYLHEEDKKLIPHVAIEKELIDGCNNYFRALRTLGIEFPWFLFITLIGVKGFSISLGGMFRRNETPIDRDVLMLPELFIEGEVTDSASILKPVFDSLWNACGFPESRNYTEEGEWKPRMYCNFKEHSH